MPNCVVRFCPNYIFRRKHSNLDVRFYRFPLDDQSRWKWEDWVRTVNGTFDYVGPRKQTFLCSSHFAEESFTPSMRLRKNAVPSIPPKCTEDVAFEVRETQVSCTSSQNTLWDVSNLLPSRSSTPLPQVTTSPSSTDASPMLADAENSLEAFELLKPDERKRKRVAYLGDITLADFATTEQAERSLALIKNQYRTMQARNNRLTVSLRRAKDKIRRLESPDIQIAKLDKKIAETKLRMAQESDFISGLSQPSIQAEIAQVELETAKTKISNAKMLKLTADLKEARKFYEAQGTSESKRDNMLSEIMNFGNLSVPAMSVLNAAACGNGQAATLDLEK